MTKNYLRKKNMKSQKFNASRLNPLPLMNRSMEKVSGLHVYEIKPSSLDALGEMGIWVKFCRWSSGRLTQHLHVFSSFAWWTKKSSCP